MGVVAFQKRVDFGFKPERRDPNHRFGIGEALIAASSQLLVLEAFFMTRVRYLIVILVAVMAGACSDIKQDQSARSLPDNQENRTVVAKRYLEVMPPKEMLQGVATRVEPNLPEKDRKVFMEVMNSQDIEKAAYRLTLDALVKHFTVAELNAMLAFYGSPDGQSASKKFDTYMRELIPQIQLEVKKAITMKEAQQQQEQKAQPAPPEQKEKKAPQGKK
jgi:hypothetical protein